MTQTRWRMRVWVPGTKKPATDYTAHEQDARMIADTLLDAFYEHFDPVAGTEHSTRGRAELVELQRQIANTAGPFDLRVGGYRVQLREVPRRPWHPITEAVTVTAQEP